MRATAVTANGIAYDRAGPRGELPVVLVHAGVADRRGLDLDTVHDAAERVVAGISGARRVDWPDAGHLALGGAVSDLTFGPSRASAW